MTITSISAELRSMAMPERAVSSARFFKTGKGEYAEGDVFIGLTVPQTRSIAKKYWQLPFADIKELLQSHIHEFRLCALLILVERYTTESDMHERIYSFYFDNIAQINNWDLVDSTAQYIVGDYLENKSRKILYTLAHSKKMWERRIGIVATNAFIKKHQFADTLAIAELLLNDEQDLIHKAVGWMLREVGKQNRSVLEGFLRKHAHHMPRTMLRYAIEHFPQTKRKIYLEMKK